MANNNHFDLCLDTLGPTGSITRPAEFMKTNGDLTITYGDNEPAQVFNAAPAVAGTAFMKVWFNENAEGTKSDAEYPAAWEAVAGTKSTNFSTDGEYYYHLVLMDAVNNESIVYNTAKITFDATAPVITANSAYIQDPDGEEAVKKLITNQLNNQYGFSFTDNLAGAKEYTVTGADIETIGPVAIADGPTSGTIGPVDFSFRAGTEDGNKTITFTLYDRAGNASISVDATIRLDTTLEKPILSLQDRAATPATLSEYINYHTINAQLLSDNSIVGYKLYEGTDPGSYTPVPDYAVNTAYTKASVVRYNRLTYTANADITAAENTGWSAIEAKMTEGFGLRKEITLSNGDGLKTIHASVKDEAGNTYDADDATVTIDTVVPVVEITSVSPLMISNVTGHTTATVTYSVSDATAGISAWAIYVNDTKVTEGSAAVSGGTFNITSATAGMVEGNNDITVWARDNAAKDAGDASSTFNEKEVTYASKLVLDTTAPTASIGTMNAWYKVKPGYTLTYGDATTGVEEIYAWTSTTSGDTTAQGAAITPTGSPMTIDASSITGTLAQSASNYMHAKVVDKVGNVTYAHAQYGFDDVAPTSVTAAFVKSSYGTTSAEINVTAYIDATSGVAQYKMTGDITAAGGTTPGTWFNVGTTLPEVVNVTLSANASAGVAETKKVQIFLKDTAGNESAQLLEISTILDQQKPVATLELRKADDSAALSARTNVQQFAARISGEDTVTGQAVGYKIWGDYNVDQAAASAGTATSKPADYTPLTYDTGKTYKLISALYATTPDGTKNVNLQVIDANGNESEITTQSFYYDTTAPTVEVSDIDYQVISKVHSLRISGGSEVAGKYADEMHFSFAPDSTCVEFKCCAYLTAEKAAAGTHADAAIPTTAGSTNMSGTGTYAASVKINSMLKGADFETALTATFNKSEMTKAQAEDAGFTITDGNPASVDGIHYVVVYVKDEGGNWSGAAVFAI